MNIEDERKHNEELLLESKKTLGDCKCFCDKTKEESSRESVRKEIINLFNNDKEAYKNIGGTIVMRPYAKELDFIYFVEAEEYSDDICFHAQQFPIDYCPYCGRKL